MIEKVCPVLLRPGAAGPDVLVFRHPLAGVQLVKGTLESGEAVAVGALRELAEESGVRAVVTADLGAADIVEGQTWHFVRVEAVGLPDAWSFDTADDGGHRFAFFWWPLECEPGADWHEISVHALRHIRARLTSPPGAPSL